MMQIEGCDLSSPARRRRRALDICIALLLAAQAPWLPATAADKAPATPPSKGAAPEDPLKAAYREASAEYALGNFRAALAKFELAFRIKQVPGLLFNIAQCHRQLKNFEQAEATYSSFIRLDPNSPQINLARQLLKQMDEVLRTQSRASTAPPLDANGSDGVKPTVTPAPPLTPAKPPDPSIAVVTAPADSKAPNTIAMAAPPPARATAPIAAPDVATISAAPPAPRRSRHIVAWTGGAASVAALGVGTIFAFQAKSQQNQLSSGNETRASEDDQINSLHRDATLGNVLFIGGAVLLAGAVAAWFAGVP